MKFINKKNILRLVILFLIFAWMQVVFGFSNEPAEKSASLSQNISEIICSIFVPNKHRKEIIPKIEPIIRKIAHLTEYMCGGFLLYGLLLTFNINSKRQFLVASLLGLFYSISDEIHQTFIPGRAGRLEDIFIDIIGVLIGECILLLIFKIVSKWFIGKSQMKT